MHFAAVLVALLNAAEPPPGGVTTNAPPAAAQAGAVPPDAGAGDREERSKVLGVQLAAGFPDGFAVSGIVRPLPWLRADAGVAHNTLAFGIQGGVTVMPWSGHVVPTLRLGGGQFFNSDVSHRFGGNLPAALGPALEQFGYHFLAAQIGFDVGNENGAVFFMRGGVAWVRSDLASTVYRQGNTTVTANDNQISATTPSIQLGVLWHLW